MWCSVCIFVLLICDYFQLCENYMASCNGYSTTLFSFPGTEVQIFPIHNENSVKEISPDSFTNFLSYHWEQSSHPQSPHLFYVISPVLIPKSLISFLILALVQRGMTVEHVEVDKWLQDLIFFPRKSPMKMENPFPLLKFPIQQWPKGFMSHGQFPKTPMWLCFSAISSWKLHVFQMVTKFPFATSDCQSLESHKLIIKISVTLLSVKFSLLQWRTVIEFG